jgi:hypothetical protein
LRTAGLPAQWQPRYVASFLADRIARAQQRGAPPEVRAGPAPIDLTGYWVSYVTENWRYCDGDRPQGEYRAFPSRPRPCRSSTPGIRPPTSARATSASRTVPGTS